MTARSECDVVLIGTGYPPSDPHRAGPATAVGRAGRWVLVDVGRGSVQRLAEAGVPLSTIDMVLLTHHHSDHVVDLASLAISRWVDGGDEPLVVVAPEGPAADFARQALDVFGEAMFVDQGVRARSERPAIAVKAFTASTHRQEVLDEEGWRLCASEVEHEPVVPAVAYRIECGAAVCISGDTRVCAGVEDLAEGVDVLVHEAVRGDLLTRAGLGALLRSNADAVTVGALAQRCGVSSLALTHLIPPPRTADDEQAFLAEVRRGGYTGRVVIGHDLARLTA